MARVGAVLWLFILLVVVPTVLYSFGAAGYVLAYLFVLNLLAGYRFWTRRRIGELGEKSMALIYLASGIFFFAFLIDPVQIDTAPVARLDSLTGWREVLAAKPDAQPALIGTPVEQMSIGRRSGTTERPWLDGLVEDVMRRPEEPRTTTGH